MNQRTCNIIMCCKGHCKLPGGETGGHLNAIAAYMADECGCPIEDYQGLLLENIMQEALFDYMNSAKRPGSDLRNLFCRTHAHEPSICERIATLFSLVQVMDGGTYMNGFTREMIRQSEEDLGENTKETGENT